MTDLVFIRHGETDWNRQQRFQGQISLAISGVGEVSDSIPFFREASHTLGQMESTPQPAWAERASLEPVRSIELCDVSYTYPGAKRPAVPTANAHLSTGRVHILLGQNGGGKTTLAKILAGLLGPSSGAVLIDGQTGYDRLRRSVSILDQDFVQFEYPASVFSTGFSELRPDAPLIASTLGVDALLGTLPNGPDTQLGLSFSGGVGLSLGQWQRLALFRALSQEASVLILDEPSSFLDSATSAALVHLLRDRPDQVVLVITHSAQLAECGDVDNGVAVCEFEGGAMATIYASRTMAFDHAATTEIVGTAGRLVVGRDGRLNQVEIADAHGIRTETTPTFWERFEDAFLRETVHFVECVRLDRPPGLTLHDATEATRIGIALRASLVERRAVEL